MSSLDKLVSDSLHDPLAAARHHAQQGGRVIGYLGAEIPVELILASGAFPLRLPGAAQSPTDAADQFLESSFMPDVRAIAEQYLQGAFDFMHSIILPRSNDSAQRLYYYLSELRTGQSARAPLPLIYDLAKIPRDASQAHSRLATLRLATELGVSVEALPAAIQRRNRRREVFHRAAQMRRGAGLRGRVMDRIFRAADRCDADAFDAAFSQWLTAAATTESGIRIVLIGSPPPDERLHGAVEEGGGNVVAEGDSHASNAVSSPLIPTDGSFDTIADHYHGLQNSTRAFINRAKLVTDLVHSVAAHGVIIWLIEEEDALIWDLPAEIAALQAIGVPTLRQVRRRWDASDGALEEIRLFTRGLSGSR
jgi:benzoyl-CoA reductase/2-hydroxyglutaryl-CoA dehydratase subunit BcrC/BadD/HgdB